MAMCSLQDWKKGKKNERLIQKWQMIMVKRARESMPTEERVDRNEMASSDLGFSDIKRSQLYYALNPRLVHLRH